MDEASIIAGVKQRLIAMAENPPYVFRDTPQQLTESYQQRLKTFVGYSEPEVARTEEKLSVRFPAVFRTYLLEMGKFPGKLFCGSDLAGIGDFERFRADALALMADTNPDLSLPPNAVVFLFHQGYTFTYLQAEGGFDSPVFQYIETETAPREVAPGFADMMDSELQLMESNHRAFHDHGGYYITIHRGGGVSQEFPALNSGDRPLDRPADERKWWKFWK